MKLPTSTAYCWGGESPVTVSSRGKNDLKKLTSSDFDVIDAFDKSFELGFVLAKGKRSSAELTLTGRIEGKRISRIPFHYPLANLYHPITGDSQFYSYKLGSKQGKLSIDGNIADEGLGKPLFLEYSLTGSGHPSGVTYGWVKNDHKNLYVAIDFTPDNTMDGAKDYTKVYVKTGSGIREFKVSVPDQKWGKPGFSYTDKVSYQHKVYEFAIPLSELDIKRVAKGEKGAPLQLAFAAYGTAAPPSLSVTKTDTPDPVTVGANLTYTMVVTNNSTSGGTIQNGDIIGSALSTVLVDTLPAGVNLVSITPSQGTCGGVGTVTCQLGTILPAGATATVTIVVSPTAAGTITNSVSVSALDVYGNGRALTVVTAQAVTTVVSAPINPGQDADLSIAKSCIPNPVGSRQLIRCSVHVINNGPAAAKAVKVIDGASSSLYYMMVLPSKGKCTGISPITCYLGTMNNGESATIHTFFTPRQTGTFVNNALVSSTTTDPAGINNFASRSIIVSMGPAPVGSLNVNSTALLAGQTVKISGSLNPLASSADLYLIELQPDGTPFFLQPGGIFTSTPTMLFSNWIDPIFSGQIYSRTFTVNDLPGTYRVFAILFQPGTSNLIATIAVTSFTLGQ